MNFPKAKKIIIILALLSTVITLFLMTDIFSAKIADAAWYSSGGVWTNRKTISVDPQKVSAVSEAYQTNFPMLVSVTDTDLKFTGSGGKVASSTGGDILFTNADGTTMLNYEIEKYASTTGELVAWVQIPFLSSTSTTPIYIYFGNASAPNNQNPTLVWDSNYKGVWHLADNAANTAVVDSTSNSINGTAAANTNTISVAGKIANGVDPGSVSKYITMGNTSTLNFTDNFTLSAWIYPTDFNYADYGGAINRLTYYGSGYGMNVIYGFPGSLTFGTPGGTGDAWTPVTSNPSINNWHLVTMLISGGTKYIYVDGVLNSTPIAGVPGSSSASFEIGRGQSFDAADFYFHGYIDETRISSTPRSADWIKTEYNNQSSPSAFYSYGGSEQENRTDPAEKAKGGIKVRGGVKFR